jgi:hypothetical protein
MKRATVAAAVLSIGAIQACVSAGGFLRLVASERDCLMGEDPIAWAVQGPAGAEGPAGAQGTQGLRGPTGLRGEAGSNGPQGEIGPEGPRGATGSQGPGPESQTWEIDIRTQILVEPRAGQPKPASPAAAYDDRHAAIEGWQGQRIDAALLPEGTTATAYLFPLVTEGGRACASIRDRISEIPISDESCITSTGCAPTDGSFPDEFFHQLPPLTVTFPMREVELYVFIDVSIADECPDQTEAYGGSHRGSWLTLSWTSAG